MIPAIARLAATDKEFAYTLHFLCEQSMRDNEMRKTLFTLASMLGHEPKERPKKRKRGVSMLEEKVPPVLDGMKIVYVRQFQVWNGKGRLACVFDFFLPEHGIALEVNGTFFHSDPRAYPDGPVHKLQQENAARWKRKLRLAEYLGYSIVELWEQDIKKEGADYIKRTIESAINATRDQLPS